MYLVETKTGYKKCNTAEEVKMFSKSEIINTYSLKEVNYDDIVSTSDIRDCIYNYLKGKQEPKEDVLEYVSNTLNIRKAEVSKVITTMKKEKLIYIVVDDGWLGID